MKRRESLFSFGVMVLVIATVCQAQGSKSKRTKKPKLPVAVAEAIKKECPNCVIARVSREEQDGIVVYDFEFRNGKGEMDVTGDGTVLERETTVRRSDIPGPALEAIRKAGGRIKLVETDEVRAEIKDGKVVKLDTSRIQYEADLVKGKKVVEIVVSADGQVIESPKWKTKVRKK